mgnify:CR=1
MNFGLARNAVCKYPIFAHVDNVYANIPLAKPPTDAKQRLSANGYRSPSQMGNCPLFCCMRLLRSAMRRHFVIILVDEFLARRAPEAKCELDTSLIFAPCLNDLPEKHAKSELFAGFSRHV